MNSQRQIDTEILAADERGSTPIRNEENKSACIRVNLRLIVGFILCICVSVAIVVQTRAERTGAPAAPLEGCLKCHKQIEPMHCYNETGTLGKLDDHGKDALGLTCTACHGGNPIATEKDSAHVRPK